MSDSEPTPDKAKRTSPPIRRSSIDKLARIDPGLPALVRRKYHDPLQTIGSIREFALRMTNGQAMLSKSAISRDRQAVLGQKTSEGVRIRKECTVRLVRSAKAVSLMDDEGNVLDRIACS